MIFDWLVLSKLVTSPGFYRYLKTPGSAQKIAFFDRVN